MNTSDHELILIEAGNGYTGAHFIYVLLPDTSLTLAIIKDKRKIIHFTEKRTSKTSFDEWLHCLVLTKFGTHLRRNIITLKETSLHDHSLSRAQRRWISLSSLLFFPHHIICFLMTRDYPQAGCNPWTVLVWFSRYVSIFWISCCIKVLSQQMRVWPVQKVPQLVREVITSDAKGLERGAMVWLILLLREVIEGILFTSSGPGALVTSLLRPQDGCSSARQPMQI